MAKTEVQIAAVLAECIEKIETGQLTLEACLERYPDQAAELETLLRTVEDIQAVPLVQPAAPFRREARRLLVAQLRSRSIEDSAFLSTLRRKWRGIHLFPSPRRLSMSWLVTLVFVASLLLGGGAAYASDAAVPGELLYSLDRTIEDLRISLSADTEALVAQHLANAEERLVEARQLASRDEGAGVDQARLWTAMANLSLPLPRKWARPTV